MNAKQAAVEADARRHVCSPFHLFRYLDEQTFRYNHRKGMNDRNRFDLAVRQMIGKRLAFDQLTGKTVEAQA